MYLRTNVRVHVCMYVCMYVFKNCMYLCMYICIYLCMYVRVYVCMYVCTSVCIYVCVYICTSSLQLYKSCSTYMKRGSRGITHSPQTEGPHLWNRPNFFVTLCAEKVDKQRLRSRGWEVRKKIK